MRFSRSPRTTFRHASSPSFRRTLPHLEGGVSEIEYPRGVGEKEGYNANMNRIDVLKFADSLFEKLDRYNVHKWVEWAWKFDLKPHGMDGIARIFTRSDMHYLDVLHQIKCAETIGKVAYAHFFFTTMLHRFTTRIPTWSDEAAIPSTLRDILLIIDEFSEQPILDGGRTRGGSTRY